MVATARTAAAKQIISLYSLGDDDVRRTQLPCAYASFHPKRHLGPFSRFAQHTRVPDTDR